MSKIIPIINSEDPLIEINNKKDLEIYDIGLQDLPNPIIPIINSKDSIIEVNNKKDLEIYDVGLQGPPGPVGPAGKDGIGIENIQKTSTEGLIDIYTIFLTNGDSYEFTVRNGKDGSIENIDSYEGPYSVTSSITNQSLSTKNLLMSDDVEINPIPYSAVSNLSDGITVTIGG